MSNYETMQNSMQIRFLKYNQEFMIEFMTFCAIQRRTAACQGDFVLLTG